MEGRPARTAPDISHSASRLVRLPPVRLFTGYQRSWLGPDVIAALTVTALLIPSGLADGELAGIVVAATGGRSPGNPAGPCGGVR